LAGSSRDFPSQFEPLRLTGEKSEQSHTVNERKESQLVGTNFIEVELKRQLVNSLIEA
jgi:hypothetical protein